MLSTKYKLLIVKFALSQQPEIVVDKKRKKNAMCIPWNKENN